MADNRVGEVGCWGCARHERVLSRRYVRDENHVSALKEVDLEILRGDFLALMGPSGSGKSTLLHVIAAMDLPSSGEVLVHGQDLRSLDSRKLARWRNTKYRIHFLIFQSDPRLDGAGECRTASEADPPEREGAD